MTTAMQIACPGTPWNILVYFLRFGSSILHKCKKRKKRRLIGHMPNNKYSITCVHQRVNNNNINEIKDSLKGSYDAILKIIICVFGVTEYVAK